jgi:hypothetical protein
MGWAHITGKVFSSTMEIGTEQIVTLSYQNIGTETWSATETRLVLARPVPRTSIFYDPAPGPLLRNPRQ